jgi:hypothetical protein
MLIGVVLPLKPALAIPCLAAEPSLKAPGGAVISDFELRIFFGLRASVFGFARLSPLRMSRRPSSACTAPTTLPQPARNRGAGNFR